MINDLITNYELGRLCIVIEIAIVTDTATDNCY